MPPSKHALLSPSSAHRWLNCNPSAVLERDFEDHETEAAALGTAMHALAEHKLLQALGHNTTRPTSPYDSPEMEQLTDGYVEYALETLAETRQECKDPQIFVELPLDLGCYIPDSHGTADCVIVADKTMHVIDLKTGAGVVVECENNPQLMVYSLGALAVFDSLYDIEEVTLHIFQPRRENVSTWSISVDALRSWAEAELKPKAELAYAGEGEYKPGAWCQFCKAAVKCRARAEAKLKLAEYEFAMPPLLTDEEIEDILSKMDDLTSWANEIKAYAQDAAINHGKQWTGFKLVESRTNRKYADETAVAQAANDAGYHDIYKQSLITITEMEKLMGKKKFNEILGGLVVRPKGKPTLVPASDKRSAINATGAEHDFNEYTEE
jgi:hypothetical protein